MDRDARRVLTEEARTRLFAARHAGGLCAGCGRALAADEPVWWARFALRGAYGWISYQSGPVGRECASPAFLQETAGQEPER